MPEKLHPTEPLEVAIDEFKNTVSEFFESRGLPGISLLLLDNAKNTPIIEADVDDDDGEIELSNSLNTLAKSIFTDTPVLVSSVRISMDAVAIEFDSEIKTDRDTDRIFITEKLAIYPEVDFDLQERALFYTVLPADYSNDPEDPRIQTRKRILKPAMVNDLTALVKSVGTREYSYITISKEQ